MKPHELRTIAGQLQELAERLTAAANPDGMTEQQAKVGRIYAARDVNQALRGIVMRMSAPRPATE